MATQYRLTLGEMLMLSMNYKDYIVTLVCIQINMLLIISN